MFIPRKPLGPVALGEAKIRLFSSRNVTDGNLSLSYIPGTESHPRGSLPEVHIDFGLREFLEAADMSYILSHTKG